MNNLDQIQTIDDYFREFSHFHVKKATELLQPLARARAGPAARLLRRDPPAVRAPGPRDRGGRSRCSTRPAAA